MVAALLLVGAIMALFFIQTFWKKLIMLGIFTAAFALSLGIMTNAKRVDIFAATAA